MKKKVICLITNWYPTPENPFQGSFFKEQALSLSDYFDFIVVHYYFSYGIIREKYCVTECGEEDNIKEYRIELTVPTLIGEVKNKLLPGTFDREDFFKERFVSVFREGIVETFDVLYCVSGQLEAGYVKMIADAYQKPYVVSEHGPVPWLGTIISEVNKNAIEQANLLLAISYDKLRQIMMQNIKIPPFIYVGNMVDESQFTYKPSNNKVKTFVFVGAHVFYKNYEMLINIMNKLKLLADVPFRLMIVGYNANKGYSKDGEKLEKAIEESNFAEYVELVPSVAHNKMHEIYNRADAFIMTSIQEGMPVSAIEAGCCGLPIFSTRCGGVEDYVDEHIGRIYNVCDVEAFTHGLCEYLEGSLCFDSVYIRESIVQRFGRKAFVRNMVEAFNSVIGE